MPGFFNKLMGKDVESRVKSMQVLANLDSAGSIPKLIKGLEDEAVEVRRAAAASLEPHGRTGDARATAALAKALSDSDAGVRSFAAGSLGEFLAVSPQHSESARAKEAILGLIEREGDEGAIKSIAMALARIQDPGMTKPVAEAFKGKDKKLIRLAIDAIDNIKATDVLIELKKELRSLL